jgi:hypothetical protein
MIVASLKGTDASNNAPTEKVIKAIINSFPLSFTSGSLDFRERLANKEPVITTIKRKIIRNTIIKDL